VEISHKLHKSETYLQLLLDTNTKSQCVICHFISASSYFSKFIIMEDVVNMDVTKDVVTVHQMQTVFYSLILSEF